MKKWSIATVDGKRFEFNFVDTVAERTIGYRDIDDVYARPSQTKIEIWKDWERWFNEHDGWCTVATYNSNFFSIEGYFEFEGIKLYAYITHAHNKLWRVEA